MKEIIFCFLAFLSGSLPFSVWLVKLFKKADVRQTGDGNPGAFNAFKMANWIVGMLVLILDISKGALPVGLAYHNFAIDWPWMLPIALAPSTGHAFSPFLGGKGGKALAVCLGIWIGLDIWKMPLVAVSLLVVWFALLTVNGWALLFTLAGMLTYLLLFQPSPLFLSVLAGQIILLVWKHREDYRKPLNFRRWVKRLFGGEKDNC